MDRQILLEEISRELDRAKTLYPRPFNNPHEGYAVILEELDELWDLIKQSKGLRANGAMRSEAIQVAAMAIRFIEELS